ncbi:glycosyltransferase [Paractinoplanes lichenicola]|uniref:Glycosyltransferase family 1 protein n=1 Tax=Paractinoplanes lichenicola TaxID=2802976 RepID=A0ABS1VP77_9ACTN|nr:glycosyltransferase [Actinoplanes lichenicola]MBL7255552.1 glycosyltransferase family 1 protein [Actinoplanes lichenicola]
MRVLIVTAGSRGDVAPFTGLGQRLERAGHRVTLAAHERFGPLVRDAGLSHYVLPGDPVELTRARTAAPGPDAARSVFAAFLDELGDGVLGAVAAGADVVLTAFGPAPLSRAVAARYGIPCAGLYLAPGVPTREFPPPGMPSGASPEENLAAGHTMLSGTSALYVDVLRRLGLAAADSGPILHGFSPVVVPRPADWPASVQVTGFWWPAVPSGWEPPASLVSFLADGPPPVFIGFGSMTEDRSEVVADAVQLAGVRAVIQSDRASPGATSFLVGDVPHEWLFPRMAAVVHHAGAGTTGAGLRAGVPAVPVPVLVDQPFWADRLHRLGVAPPPMASLTAESLAGSIRACLDQPSYRERAAEVAARIATEDGAAPVLELLSRWDSACRHG